MSCPRDINPQAVITMHIAQGTVTLAPVGQLQKPVGIGAWCRLAGLQERTKGEGIAERHIGNKPLLLCILINSAQSLASFGVGDKGERAAFLCRFMVVCRALFRLLSPCFRKAVIFDCETGKAE